MEGHRLTLRWVLLNIMAWRCLQGASSKPQPNRSRARFLQPETAARQQRRVPWPSGSARASPPMPLLKTIIVHCR